MNRRPRGPGRRDAARASLGGSTMVGTPLGDREKGGGGVLVNMLTEMVAGLNLLSVQVEVVDKSNGFGWSEFFSLISTAGSIILLIVTGRTLSANKRMAQSSNDAALATKEASAAAASQIQVKFVADPEYTVWKPEIYDFTFDFQEELIQVEEQINKYPTSWAIPEELYKQKIELDQQYQKQLGSYKKKFQKTPTEVRINVYLSVEGATVEVHRVALVEYPFSRHERFDPPTVAGRTPNSAPDFYWGLRSPALGGGSVLLYPGDRYLFEMPNDFVLAPGMVEAFLQHNRFAVEYSFVGSDTKRVARAYLRNPATYEGREIPVYGGALTELPAVLTSDLSPGGVASAERWAQIPPLKREIKVTVRQGGGGGAGKCRETLARFGAWLTETC